MGKYRSKLDKELDSIKDKFKEEELEIKNNIEKNSSKILEEEYWVHSSKIYQEQEFEDLKFSTKELLNDNCSTIEKELILTKSDYLSELLDKPYKKPNFI